MTIQVEDGTGIATANSYASVEFADAYFAARNNVEWSALTADQKSAALVLATDYIDMMFGGRFAGYQPFASQGLAFPRVIPAYGTLPVVPVQVLKATCEYAVRAAFKPLAPDADVDSTGQQILKKVETVGPINEETTYQSGGNQPSAVLRSYPAADALLAGLIRSGGGTYRS